MHEWFPKPSFAFSSHGIFDPDRKPVHSFISTHILPSPFSGFNQYHSIENVQKCGSLTFITFIAITFISIFPILLIFFIAFYCWSDTSILLILSFSVDTISVTVTGMSLVAAFVLSKKSIDLRRPVLILYDPIPYHDIARYLALCRYYKRNNNFRLYSCNADCDHKCMVGQKYQMLPQERLLLSIRQYLHT